MVHSLSGHLNINIDNRLLLLIKITGVERETGYPMVPPILSVLIILLTAREARTKLNSFTTIKSEYAYCSENKLLLICIIVSRGWIQQRTLKKYILVELNMVSWTFLSLYDAIVINEWSQDWSRYFNTNI